ncbi:hypothetical protein BD626DRAFT_415795, partial [Schizophyllum amplum]
MDSDAPQQCVSSDDTKAEEARLRRVRADPVLDKICRNEARQLPFEAIVDPSIDPTTLPVVPYYKRRIVFQHWPAWPNPEELKIPLAFEGPKGKEAANGWPLWGASLYSFYEYIVRKEGVELSAMGTATRMAAWAKEIGGAYPDWARREIEAAMHEPDPEKVPVYDVNKLLLTAEADREPATDEERKFVKSRLANPKLEAPMRMLPRTLIVHDPWNLLSI